MLWTITIILFILWVVGLVSSYTLGGWIHILLVARHHRAHLQPDVPADEWSDRPANAPWTAASPQASPAALKESSQ